MICRFPARFAVLASLCVTSLLISSCGSGTATSSVKKYRLTLVSGDTSLVPELKQLVTDYNNFAGMTVITYEDDPSQANSPIVITQGLQSTTDGYVGLGQWQSEAVTSSPFSTLPGQPQKQTVTYSMNLTFDHDYLAALNHYNNQKLFFHEVGHGLQMNHITTDATEVMYPDVSGTKNFTPYFQRVQAYMSE